MSAITPVMLSPCTPLYFVDYKLAIVVTIIFYFCVIECVPSHTKKSVQICRAVSDT